jgi:hypothetical protein
VTAVLALRGLRVLVCDFACSREAMRLYGSAVLMQSYDCLLHACIANALKHEAIPTGAR